MEGTELDWRSIGPFPSREQKKWLASRTDSEWLDIVHESTQGILTTVQTLSEVFRDFAHSGLCMGKSTLRFRSYRGIPAKIEDCWVFQESPRVTDWLRQLDATYQIALSDGSRRGLRFTRLMSSRYSIDLPNENAKAISFEIDDDDCGLVWELLLGMRSCPMLTNAKIIAELAEPQLQFSEMLDRCGEEWELATR